MPRRGKQWLHLDYSPPQGCIFQACLQLFPQTAAMGAGWERIALMVCKAPTSWMSPRAERALLACCITGAASRATAGVTWGLLHARRLSEQLGPGGGRLLPALTDAPLTLIRSGLDSRIDDRTIPHGLVRLSVPAELARHLSVAELRKTVPPHVLHYISPGAAPVQLPGVAVLSDSPLWRQPVPSPARSPASSVAREAFECTKDTADTAGLKRTWGTDVGGSRNIALAGGVRLACDRALSDSEEEPVRVKRNKRQRVVASHSEGTQ